MGVSPWYSAVGKKEEANKVEAVATTTTNELSSPCRDDVSYGNHSVEPVFVVGKRQG